jgi:S1-C subfamily serine protease
LHSPAATAGLAAGDVILGPPGEHFSRRAGLREWVLTSLVNDVRELEVVRDGRRSTVTIRVGVAPG